MNHLPGKTPPPDGLYNPALASRAVLGFAEPGGHPEDAGGRVENVAARPGTGR